MIDKKPKINRLEQEFPQYKFKLGETLRHRPEMWGLVRAAHGHRIG
jgi:hypothetical protein